MNDERKVALVTGSSTGIGFETSLLLARKGFYTYATMRKLQDSDKILNISRKEQLPLEVLPLDVNDDKSVSDSILKIDEKNKRIDVLVNNAGYALAGPLEGTSMDEIKTQFETNFFGAIKVMQSVIPIMRKQKSGRIVNITSMGGRVAVPLDPIYHGTKFALEGVSECIRYELGPFGIRMILIEPGAVGSNFWKNLKMTSVSQSPDSPYRQILDDISKVFSKMTENVIHPSEVAKVVVDAVTSEDPEFRYVVGKDANIIIDAKKNMSEREYEHFIKEQFNLKY
jgi:NAD(P)-dependent dehydrogenase (short-subunit alcohol dehydrogenase family)